MILYRLILAIIGLYCLVLLPAQNPTALLVIDSVNQKLSVIKQGYFDSSYRWKSATATDTSTGAARVFFFKTEPTRDSISQFIILRSGLLSEAYDGWNLYYVNHEKKSVSSRAANEKKGIVQMLNAGVRGMLAFRPYLLKERALRPDKFQNALIDTISFSAGKAFKITVLDSFKNELKLTATDLNMGQVKEIYEISSPGCSLVKKQEIITFMIMPQYLETNLSPITALPDSVTFERVFNLPALLASGYELIDNALKASPAQLPPPKLSVGDTVPAFRLKNLEGAEISTGNFTDGLILLDFWYKSCAPCLMAMPLIERLHQHYGKRGLQVFGVDGADKDAEDIRSFLRSREVTYPSLLDPDKGLASRMRVTGYPTLFLLEAKTRKILFIHEGFSAEAESKMAEIVEAWLKKNFKR